MFDCQIVRDSTWVSVPREAQPEGSLLPKHVGLLRKRSGNQPWQYDHPRFTPCFRRCSPWNLWNLHIYVGVYGGWSCISLWFPMIFSWIYHSHVWTSHVWRRPGLSWTPMKLVYQPVQRPCAWAMEMEHGNGMTLASLGNDQHGVYYTKGWVTSKYLLRP